MLWLQLYVLLIMAVPAAPRQRKLAETVWPMPDAVITVICAPDDGSSSCSTTTEGTETVWPVPDAVITVICAPDNGSSNCSTTTEGSRDGLTNARCCDYSYICSWWWVELPPETCRASSLQKYNKLYIVASRWTVIHIHAVTCQRS